MSRTHVLVLPFPAQGHINPLMELSHELVKRGIKITFVNTNFNHERIMKVRAMRGGGGGEQVENDLIQLVSIPDGLEQEENKDRGLERLLESMWKVMPKKLEKLIQEINESVGEMISCVVADGAMGWALEVAEKMGIHGAAFIPTSASLLALFLSIPKLLDDGIIDSNGTPIKDQIIHLAPEMPAMRTKHFLWTQVCDLNAQRIVFHFIMRGNKALESTDWVICNSTQELEPQTFAFSPNIFPIGPLQARKNNHTDHLAGSFWPADSTCMNWLDLQQDKSVIYVAFGSIAIFDHNQLQELALGLELSNKPFLWVVRSDINKEANYDFLKEFEERLSSRGKVIGWAPQQKVLNHRSIACFLSHCGWNSTLEGLINGVPFLCWPFFADQFLDETYISDIWKVGLRLGRNEGIISREEVASKINQVFHDEGFRLRALELKEKAINSVKDGGRSNKNLKNFVDWLKA
ncbi:UDP-glycosyltransferase 83A1-like [Prosopis cineraria]|uniref:UDP-glycosyltransferase 83A1-like n=1 Tax=Prosopis cineraria TaxID=364024 RepID=UPI00240FFD9B|nr:UDP-glycosyltransferase 83A1-like [Prosopis cineraria]